MAPNALAHCIAKLILANEKGDDSDELKECRGFLSSLAEMSLEKRSENVGAKVDHELWRAAFEQLCKAFREPIESNTLSRVVKRPLSPELVPELFDYDAFLRGLGRMSLNLETHGGLYMLHSHINHTCDPNLSIRHLHQRVSLSRITAIARYRIEPGDELTITYVNPNMGVRARRQALREWNWGQCDCARCIREAKLVDSAKNDANKTSAAATQVENPSPRSELDTTELEKELKESLGF